MPSQDEIYEINNSYRDHPEKYGRHPTLRYEIYVREWKSTIALSGA